MKKILKNTRWFTVITTLCFVAVALFAANGCEKPETPNMSGMWKVKAISISGKLTNIDLPPDNAHYSDILITIPDAKQGSIEGHTFYNTIGMEFEILEHQQISFKNYGGTRIAEDEWGEAFRDHIMFKVLKFKISDNELIF